MLKFVVVGTYRWKGKQLYVIIQFQVRNHTAYKFYRGVAPYYTRDRAEEGFWGCSGSNSCRGDDAISEEECSSDGAYLPCDHRQGVQAERDRKRGAQRSKGEGSLDSVDKGDLDRGAQGWERNRRLPNNDEEAAQVSRWGRITAAWRTNFQCEAN